MGANLLLATEDFTNAAWTNLDATITPGAAAGPVGYSPSAAKATTIEDATTLAQALLFQDVAKAGGDTDAYISSVFVRKTAIQVFLSTQPFFVGVSSIGVGFNFDPSTGNTGISPDVTAPPAYGVVDFDSLWWRIWCRFADTLSNTAIRYFLYPARITQTAITESADSTALGSAIWWGANLTKSSVLLPYNPEPFYAIQRVVVRL